MAFSLADCLHGIGAAWHGWVAVCYDDQFMEHNMVGVMELGNGKAICGHHEFLLLFVLSTSCCCSDSKK